MIPKGRKAEAELLSALAELMLQTEAFLDADAKDHGGYTSGKSCPHCVRIRDMRAELKKIKGLIKQRGIESYGRRAGDI